MQVGNIDPYQVREGSSAWRQRISVRIQIPRAESCCHAGAAVVGGAAAQADDDPAIAFIHRRAHQFPGAVSGGASRVASVIGYQRQSGCQSHFDDGGFAVAHDAPTSGDWITQRAGNHGLAIGPARGVDERGQCPVAAVGNGNQDGFGVGCGSEDAALDCQRGFTGADAVLECLGRDDYS